MNELIGVVQKDRVLGRSGFASALDSSVSAGTTR